MTIQEKAQEALKFYETKKRNDGNEFVTLKNGAPESLTTLNRNAHNGVMKMGICLYPRQMTPDDWTYKFIKEALIGIAECSHPDEIQTESDMYTHELTTWLSSNIARVEYITESLAQAEWKSGFDILSHAQYLEKIEVLHIVITELEKIEF
jgi:hypothetical protein